MRQPACLMALTPRLRSARTLLLLSAAVVGLAAGTALAAPARTGAAANPDFALPTVGVKPKPAAAPTQDDGLGQHDVYVEADDMVDDRPNTTVTATGHVEVRYQQKTLRADKVVYTRSTAPFTPLAMWR